MRIPLARSRPITLFVTITGDRGTREILSVLDTGASFVVIPTEDAIHIGYDLTRAPRFPVLAASGVIEAPKVVLREVWVGHLHARDVEALCYDLPTGEISALLGLSFLERFTTTLDYKTSTMEILDP